MTLSTTTTTTTTTITTITLQDRCLFRYVENQMTINEANQKETNTNNNNNNLPL